MIFFKLMFLLKNKQIQLYYLSTCFCSFFGRKWRHKKNILKLTDLSEVNIASVPFSVMEVAGHLGCECFSHLSLIPKYIERIYWGLKRHYAFYAEKVFNVVNVWLVAYWKCQKGLVFHNVCATHFHLKWNGFQFC